MKFQIFFYSNVLAIRHGFPDIMHIKSAILNIFRVEIFRSYPYLKPHILYYGNSLSIWHGFPDITYIKKIILAAVTYFLSNACNRVRVWLTGVITTFFNFGLTGSAEASRYQGRWFDPSAGQF